MDVNMRDCVKNALEGYTHNGKTITSLGKFEGEPIWAPALWEAAIEGRADFDLWDDPENETSPITYFFILDDEMLDVTKESPLPMWARSVMIWEDESGFIHTDWSNRVTAPYAD